MKANFTIKNYRCFDDSQPLHLSISDGFTAFVGPNNSGKSSILKFFYEFRDLWQALSHPTPGIANAIGEGGNVAFNGPNGILDPTEGFSNKNNRNITIEIYLSEISQQQNKDIGVRLIIQREPSIAAQVSILQDGKILPMDKSEFRGNQLHHDKTEVSIDLTEFFELCQALSQAIYIGPFRNAINVGANQQYFDIDVGDAFIKTWNSWQTGRDKRQNEAIQKVVQDIKEVFKLNGLIIVSSQDLRTMQIFVNDKSYKLPELGSGIAQFIIVLGNVAVKNPTFLLIDEPELNLHPALQLNFLTSLASYSKYGVLFATHSVGLARSSAELIYSVQQNSDGQSIVKELQNSGDTLLFQKFTF